jgi:mycothiol maleylpyruvate isomerase-like protein
VTSSPFGFEEALAAVAAESRRLTERVGSSDLDQQVPSCPAWSVRDLGHHIGEVQWYWAENVRARNADERSGSSLTALPSDDELVAWMGWCTESLLSALTESGPDAPCWTWWAAPRTTRAVARHQAQEAAVHRWDAEGVGAPGSGGPLPTELAGDGVPEFVEIMIGPAAEALSGAVTLVASDVGDRWRVAGAAATARPGATKEAELEATASDLVLMLYRRLPVPDADVVGDPLLVASLLSLADTT